MSAAAPLSGQYTHVQYTVLCSLPDTVSLQFYGWYGSGSRIWNFRYGSANQTELWHVSGSGSRQKGIQYPRKILNIWFKKLSKLCFKKYRFIFVFSVFVDADDTDLDPDPDPAVAKTCRLNLHFFGHPSYVTIFLIGILSILYFTVLHMYPPPLPPIASFVCVTEHPQTEER